MNYLRIIQVGIPVVLAILAGVFFWQWQNAREEVGAIKITLKAEQSTVSNFRAQLKSANDKILQMADEGAVSYGHCQDLAKTSVTEAFDRGVLFGRNTCPKLP